MEFEDVSEEVLRQCQRVAAAFGVTKWTWYPHPPFVISDNLDFSGYNGPYMVRWLIWSRTGTESELCIVSIGDTELLRIHLEFDAVFEIREEPLPGESELMARGLYCLGFEDETILSQLSPLSAHEKMELRLSFPREFWPQKWLDEEGE
ncbi:hypothetical protein IAD21_03729 [Abditibacteriota bacterium]|nr:hypothetical protein IAD21_03729 [Abditibacteriota bacterium]